jgi:SAM-dependent methyltransferase
MIKKILRFIKRKIIYFFEFQKDKITIKKQLKNQHDFHVSRYWMLYDKDSNSGVASGHYFHQDLLVANRIFQNKPVKHVDIGSRVDTFVAHVASYRKIEVIDIRPQNADINNVIFRQLDLMNLTEKFINYSDSISSLHAIEHFGLGRYGDPVDVNGHLKGLENIYLMLRKKGIFYFSVPIGPQRIEFNAHRVFSVEYLVNIFKGKYKFINFSYVDDRGYLHRDVKFNDKSIKDNFNCIYGCGIFELKKL